MLLVNFGFLMLAGLLPSFASAQVVLSYEEENYHPKGFTCTVAYGELKNAKKISGYRLQPEVVSVARLCDAVAEKLRLAGPTTNVATAQHSTRTLNSLEIGQVAAMCGSIKQAGGKVPPVCGTAPFTVRK